MLDYVTELTCDKNVKQATFDRMQQFYSERQICEIVWLAASEHLYNITNIGLNIHSDMLCDISRKKSAAAPVTDQEARPPLQQRKTPPL